MNRLDEIIATKHREVEQLRPVATTLRRQALQRNDFRVFQTALHRPDGKIAVIAEVKKASPSAGIIAESFDPVTIAESYELGGAAAISVLTDQQFFQGRLSYLQDVRRHVSVPLLRKDFIVDEVQVWESAAAGADAILLIVAVLTQQQLRDLLASAGKYQLDAVVEVHTLEELERALDAGAEIIGINNRDLKSFQVDLGVTEKLSEEVPNDVVLVSESGIKSPDEVKRVKACGANAVLVGEALMRGELTIEQIAVL